MRFNLFVRFKNDEFRTALWPVCRDNPHSGDPFFVGCVAERPASFATDDTTITQAIAYATSLRGVDAVEVREEPNPDQHDGDALNTCAGDIGARS